MAFTRVEPKCKYADLDKLSLLERACSELEYEGKLPKGDGDLKAKRAPITIVYQCKERILVQEMLFTFKMEKEIGITVWTPYPNHADEKKRVRKNLSSVKSTSAPCVQIQDKSLEKKSLGENIMAVERGEESYAVVCKKNVKDGKGHHWKKRAAEGTFPRLSDTVKIWLYRLRKMEYIFFRRYYNGDFPKNEVLPWKTTHTMNKVGSTGRVVYLQLLFLARDDVIIWGREDNLKVGFYGILWFIVHRENIGIFNECYVPSKQGVDPNNKNPCKKTISKIWKTIGFVEKYDISEGYYIFYYDEDFKEGQRKMHAKQHELQRSRLNM